MADSQLTPDSFMSAQGGDLTPDSFMASQQSAPLSSGLPDPQTAVQMATDRARAAAEVATRPAPPQGTELWHGGPRATPDMGKTPPPLPGTANQRFIEAVTQPIIPFSKIAPQGAGVASGIARGAADLAEGLTTPANVVLAGATGGLGALGKAGKVAQRLISAGFGADMVKSAYDQLPEVRKAMDSGDHGAAAQAITKFIGTLVMAGAAGTHAVRGGGAAETKAAPAETPQITPDEFMRQQAQNPPSPRKTAPPASISVDGPSDRVQRVQDARERIAQRLTNKTWTDLNNPDRLAIDELVRQGYGFAAQPQKEGENAGKLGTAQSGREAEGANGQAGGQVEGQRAAGAQPAGRGERGVESAGPARAEVTPTAPKVVTNPESKAQQVAPEQQVGPAKIADRTPGTPPAYGNAVNVQVPGEQTSYPARYAVREASDVVPSHNPQSFERNPDYEFQNDRDYSQAGNAARVVKHSSPGTFKPDYTLTESPTAEHGAPVIDARGNALGGNNRTMTIQRVYARGGEDALKYRNTLKDKAAQFGIDPGQVDRFNNPVLVRELRNPVSPQEGQLAITNFNKAAAAQLSPAEQAVADGKRITPSTARTLAARIEHTGEDSTLGQALQGENGGEVLNELVNDGVFTRQEANGFVDERGHLTADAKDRIGKMIVGRLFSSPAEFNQTPPELRAKLERVAPHVLRVEGREGWGITPQVQQAVAALQDARAHGIRNLDDLARQSTLSSSTGKSYSPESLAIAKKLQEGPNAAARAFRLYANDEALSRPGTQASMFEPLTREQSFRAAFEEPQFSRQIDKQTPPSATRDRLYQDADWEAMPAVGDRRPNRLRLNQQAFEALSDAIGTRFNGVALRPQDAKNLANALTDRIVERWHAGQVSTDTANHLSKLADAIDDAGAGAAAVLYQSDGSLTIGERAQLLREELTHWQQQRVGDFPGMTMEDAKALLAHHAAPLGQRSLQRLGYSDDPMRMANEIGAKLAAGKYEELKLSRKQGLDFLEHYASTLTLRHSPTEAQNILRFVDARSQPFVARAIDRAAARADLRGKWPTGGSPTSDRPPVGGMEARRPRGLGSGETTAELRQPSGSEEVFGADRNAGTEERRTGGDALPGMAEGRPSGARSEIRRDVSPGQLARSADEAQRSADRRGERGAAPAISDFAGYLRSKFGPKDAAKANYSGLGATKDKFVRNLSQLEEASPEAHEAVVRAAQSRSQSAVLIRAAAPRIAEALGKNGPSFSDFRRALVESRLQGTQQRWADLARQTRWQSDEAIGKAFENGIGDLLSNIEGKRGLPQDVGQTAAALLEAKDYPTLRQFLGQTFDDAAGAVAHAMTPDEFDQVRHHPNFRGALGVYKELLEKPLNTNHALNEGVFSTALGPLDTYYPLSPVAAEDVARARAGKAYAKPKNPGNSFATGLAQGYDDSMAALSDKLARAFHANNKAAAINALEDAGLITELRPGQRPADEIELDGQRYRATTLPAGNDRQIIRDGKSTFVPGKRYAAPKWLARELDPVFGEQDLRRFSEKGIAGKINDVAIQGPADLAFHSANLFGTLVSNTPGLGTALADRVASAPFLKRLTSVVKAMRTDPTTPEAARDLQDMARIGVLPERFASETYSRNYSELTGAELRRFSLSPMLFGPKGIDVRTRLTMYRIAKDFNPDAKPAETYKFVNQLGIYTRSLESGITRGLKDSGLAPFATAGSQMVRNGINAWLGTGPMPQAGSLGQRLAAQLTGGAVGTVAMWVLAHHAVTGKWPWDDPKSQFMKIPVPDAVRRTPLGRQLWGTKPGTAYADMSFWAPMVKRGASALGVSQAYDTWRSGGSGRQIGEAAATGPINAALHPMIGSIPRALFVGVTGQEPYVTGLTNREGEAGLQLLPAVPKGEAFPHLGAAAKQLNSFYGNAATATGFSPEQPWEKNEGNRWIRMVTDMVAPGLLGRVANMPAKREALRKQASAERHARALAIR